MWTIKLLIVKQLFFFFLSLSPVSHLGEMSNSKLRTFNHELFIAEMKGKSYIIFLAVLIVKLGKKRADLKFQ